MCNIDVSVQMKVFERSTISHNAKKEAIKRLYASGFVTRKGKMTQWYKTLIDRAHGATL